MLYFCVPFVFGFAKAFFMVFKLLKALGENRSTRIVFKFCMNRVAELLNFLDSGSNTELAIEE